MLVLFAKVAHFYSFWRNFHECKSSAKLKLVSLRNVLLQEMESYVNMHMYCIAVVLYLSLAKD